MGYELHIIRFKDWENDEEESNISLVEWLAYVQTDNELELTNGFDIENPGFENVFQNKPGFCYCTKHSTHINDDRPWFDYGYGEISTKYTDDETIKKMIAISNKLGAKVQGDDGEFYDENTFNGNK